MQNKSLNVFGNYTQFDTAPHSTHNLVVSLVPAGARVLEFGCATGYMSEVLKARLNCSVTGVEISPSAGELARRYCDRIIIGDAEVLDFSEIFKAEQFDIILFADVLEHLRDPDAVLQRVRPLLAEDGLIIASLPNIAHGSVRLALLNGEFRYHETGLLDTTHLRFFTRESVQDLFEGSGYVITNWLRQQVEINRTEIAIPVWPVPEAIQECLAKDPEVTTYQFIIQAAHAEAVGAQGQAHADGLANLDQSKVGRAIHISEHEQWERMHTGLPLAEADKPIQESYRELIARIAELLPAGSKTLEIGCGGGGRSLALASVGYRVSLQDFSSDALDYARSLFAREQLEADFIQGNDFTRGAPEYDLVFSTGTLEHYSFDQQVAFLRALASRSRKYVLVLVPNRLCYWYWLWRIQKAGGGDWPFGKLVPLADLSATFEAAGLHFLGETFLGASWTDAFINSLAGLKPELRDEILAIHHAAIIPVSQKSYLLAALGSVVPDIKATNFRTAPPAEQVQQAEMQTILADALALRMSAEHSLRQLQACVVEQQQTISGQQQTITWHERNAQGLIEQQNLISQTLLAIQQSKWLRIANYYWATRRAGLDFTHGKYRLFRQWLRGVIPIKWRRSVVNFSQPPQLQVKESAAEFPQHQKTQEFIALSERTSEGRYDIVCFPIIDWDFRFQRPQQLLSRFAARGHRVFYLSQKFRSAGLPYELCLKGKNIFEVSLRAPARDIYTDSLDQRACNEMFESLNALRRDLSLGATVACVQLPFWWPLARRTRDEFAWPIVYDCMDYHAGFATSHSGMVRAEAQLLSSADWVVVSSAFLQKEVETRNTQVKLIRNACDYDHFARVAAPKPRSARPVVGYYGAIADWFDADLVADIAESRPAWDFVLLGSTALADTSRLSKLPNVRLTGEKPYAELPNWLSKFDVTIIPFKRVPLTEATNPVKAYEIFAAGKPLVSVPLPEVAALGDVVRLASTAPEFVREIEAALAEDSPELVQQRRTFALEHTWEKRYEALAPTVREAFPQASIIIVTYNNLELNRLCLQSLYQRTEWPNFEVIVVDNASTDGTPNYLKEAEHSFPSLRVVLNDSNLGFAAANNIGLKMARGDYLVLLNNDTVVVQGWLSTLIRHLAADKRLGLIGPVTNEIGNEAKVPVGYAQLTELPQWAAQFTREHDNDLFDIPMLAMFCVAMRREVFEQVGPLDEQFGMGMFEDDDYTLRVKKCGYQVKCANDAFIHHVGRASFKQLSEEQYRAVFDENRRRYEAKWGQQWQPHKPR